MRSLDKPAFLFLLVAVSAAFVWVMWPFYGAILWGIAVTVVFRPLHRRLLQRMPGRHNLVSLLVLLVIIGLVILPATLIIVSLLQEVSNTYARIESGQINFSDALRQLQGALPDWAYGLLVGFGLTDMDSIRDQISSGLSNSIQSLAGRAVNVGQSALGFLVTVGVMLYLTFFLLRDGQKLTHQIGESMPLPIGTRRLLWDKFLVVVRATLKGSMVVAAIQGMIGGSLFWALDIHAPLLWGVLMAFLSLLPAVGTGFVWLPVALYLLATGDVWQGVVLILCGVFVISLVDNLLRPILVGKGAKLPDYLVLISTLGGIQIFGFNGIIMGPLIAAMFIAVWDISTAARHGAAEAREQDEAPPEAGA